jgi:hypothetical protein
VIGKITPTPRGRREGFSERAGSSDTIASAHAHSTDAGVPRLDRQREPVAPLSIAQFAAFVQAEAEKCQRIIKLTGVKAE